MSSLIDFSVVTNWRRKGRLLNKHRPHSATPDGGVVTSVAIDHEWIVVGLASCRIQVFSARTGVLSRTLVGHESGVWAVHLVSAGGYLAQPPPGMTSSRPVESLNIEELDFKLPNSLCTAIGLDKPRAAVPFDPTAPPKPSDVCCVSEGWGNASALIVSGGCDKQLRVWDVKSGYCIYVLEGHSSTIRCLRVLHNRPIAVSGSRDATLRVWDVQRGKLLRTLTGHEESVRCLDVCGNQAVSGSYDCTCRVSNIYLPYEVYCNFVNFSCGILIRENAFMFFADICTRYILLHTTGNISHLVDWTRLFGYGTLLMGKFYVQLPREFALMKPIDVVLLSCKGTLHLFVNYNFWAIHWQQVAPTVE